MPRSLLLDAQEQLTIIQNMPHLERVSYIHEEMLPPMEPHAEYAAALLAAYEQGLLTPNDHVGYIMRGQSLQ